MRSCQCGSGRPKLDMSNGPTHVESAAATSPPWGMFSMVDVSRHYAASATFGMPPHVPTAALVPTAANPPEFEQWWQASA